jgi:hypothetical protein
MLHIVLIANAGNNFQDIAFWLKNSRIFVVLVLLYSKRRHSSVVELKVMMIAETAGIR